MRFDQCERGRGPGGALREPLPPRPSAGGPGGRGKRKGLRPARVSGTSSRCRGGGAGRRASLPVPVSAAGGLETCGRLGAPCSAL